MKNKPPMSVKISVEKEILFGDVLSDIIEKYDCKRVLSLLASKYIYQSAMCESPFSALLKNKKQIDKLCENSEAFWVLVYAIDNWDELKEKGKKYCEEKAKESENKWENENVKR